MYFSPRIAEAIAAMTLITTAKTRMIVEGVLERRADQLREEGPAGDELRLPGAEMGKHLRPEELFSGL